MSDTGDDSPQFEQLLEFLKAQRAIDFTGYKRTSLRRRVARRLEELGLDDFAALQDHLEVHPDEFEQLFNTILINVTSFFRDPEAWQYLATEVLPDVVARAGDGPIRAWTAGCSSGEEAYTLAMLLTDLVGEEAMRDRVKIYATDVDEDALSLARHATYTAEALRNVPDEHRRRYFEKVGGRFQFRPDLRRSVIFGRHDLVRDAPISRLDLLTCRNVLMYLNRDTQARVLERLHFALQPAGFLMLGRAEMLLTRSNLFEPVSLRHRVFRPVPATVALPSPAPRAATPPRSISPGIRLRESAFDASPTAQLAIDVNGTLHVVNERCRTMFGLHPGDVGRPFRDLELSYRPVDLRSHVDQVVQERRSTQLRSIEWRAGDRPPQYLDIVLSPLLDEDELVGVAIAFLDVTHFEELRGRLQQAQQDLETSYEELQSTNEELETTNEELQSSNEELETTNEELQSSNEELETMNEELQSSNAEQTEVASELTMRSAALDDANAFLEGILSSLAVSVVVVDTDFAVRIWNQRSFDLWGLRTEEVLGRSLLNLDIGLPVGELANPIRRAVEGDTVSFDVAAVTRRGRTVTVRGTITPLYDRQDGASGAVLLLDASSGGAEAAG